MSKVKNFMLSVAAFATVSFNFAMSQAQAAGSSTIGDAATGLIDDIGNVGKAGVAGMFLGGLFLVGAGLLKLKQASESQGGQVKYADGLWRIAVGAGLVAIPAVTGMLSATLGLGGTATITDAGGASF